MARRIGVACALACALLMTVSGCGPVTPSRAQKAPAAHITPDIERSPSAAHGGPCAGVTSTTSIDDVAPACQALWVPYGVTEVPPSNELALERVPNAPTVVNRTGGAVSDATAQHWADASNWDSGWWKWAQAHGQLFMLRTLVGPALIPVAEVEALQHGGTVQPDCNLYPISSTLLPVGDAGRAYFARKHLPADDAYLFVVVYRGPCSEMLTAPGGRTTSLVDFTENTIVFAPGTLRRDPVLGDLWFADAGGNCQDPLGPPPSWCGR